MKYFDLREEVLVPVLVSCLSQPLSAISRSSRPFYAGTECVTAWHCTFTVRVLQNGVEANVRVSFSFMLHLVCSPTVTINDLALFWVH